MKTNYLLRHKITPHKDQVNKASKEKDLLQDGLHQTIFHNHQLDGNLAIQFLQLLKVGLHQIVINLDLVKEAKEVTNLSNKEAREVEEKNVEIKVKEEKMEKMEKMEEKAKDQANMVKKKKR